MATRKNQTYRDHQIILDQALGQVLRSGKFKLRSDGVTTQLVENGIAHTFAIKGTLLPQGDCLYVEFANDKHPPIWSKSGIDWLLFYINQQTLLIDWKELRAEIDRTKDQLEVRMSPTSSGWLFPVAAIPKCRVFE